MDSMIIILAAVLLGAALALVGVALGGLLVFRTKKEPGAGLFNTRTERGDAYIMDDFESEPDQPSKGRDQKIEDPVPSIVAKQTERFLSQIKDKHASQM